jgi:hypothetical protein
MKRWIAICTAAIMIAACPAVSTIDKTFAAAPLEMTVDGETALSPLHPFKEGDIVYIPIRVLTEFYPVKLQWDNKLKQVTIKDDSTSTIIKSGSALYLYFGSTSVMEGKAILRKGHLYIPASMLNSLTGGDFRLDQKQNTVAITSGSVSTTVRTPAEALAAAENHPKVKIYAALKEQSTYKGYILEVNGKKHQFAWETPRDLSYPPQLYYADVNKDGQPEAVVILTLGTGTGIVAQEIHIVKPETWKELTVPEAWKAASQLVSSTIVPDHEDMVVSLKLKGASPAEVTLRLPDRAEDKYISDTAGIGSVTYYSVDSDRLIAEVNVTTGFSESIGSLKLVYKPADSGKAMVPESVTFMPYKEYPATIKELSAND